MPVNKPFPARPKPPTPPKPPKNKPSSSRPSKPGAVTGAGVPQDMLMRGTANSSGAATTKKVKSFMKKYGQA